mmetsp:Transcript_27949/g.31957  ORF Transcript_27949/g.31957 Transcript_27949/m.31957 type:complete len:407 (+) Transcript_27949:31-1251(+)
MAFSNTYFGRRHLVVLLIASLVLILSLVFLPDYGVLQLSGLRVNNSLPRRLSFDPRTVEEKPHDNNNNNIYKPALIERYIIDNFDKMLQHVNSDREVPTDRLDACYIYKEETQNMFLNEIKQDLNVHKNEFLDSYNEKIRQFPPIQDLRSQFNNDNSNNHEVCQQVDIISRVLNEGGDKFGSHKLLSINNKGYIEPILPPLRDPKFCGSPKLDNIMDMDYFIHDFTAMCQQLKKTSRIILIDMGASPLFHSTEGEHNPAIYLTSLYAKFGMAFDHVYAYELTQIDPTEVYKSLPPNMIASYHWINIGVSADPHSFQNPFKMLLENYNEDDLIVVKLDIDANDIELEFLRQIMVNTQLQKLIDQLYWENNSVFGMGSDQEITATLTKKSLEMFTDLRTLGVAVHPWV